MKLVCQWKDGYVFIGCLASIDTEQNFFHTLAQQMSSPSKRQKVEKKEEKQRPTVSKFVCTAVKPHECVRVGGISVNIYNLPAILRRLNITKPPEGKTVAECLQRWKDIQSGVPLTPENNTEFFAHYFGEAWPTIARSEERRVGKECRL